MRVFISIIFCSLVLFSIISCSGSKKDGSGQMISQTRQVSGFNQIFFSGNGSLFITQGETESVKIEGEEEILDLITTVVIDKALHIDYKKTSTAYLIRDKPAVNIYIQVKDIQEIRLSGSGTISTLTPLNSYNLKVSLSGSVNGEIETVGHKLVAILSGSNSLVARGKVENQDLWINGSGSYEGEKLSSKVTNINISGSGKVAVSVQDELEIRISGYGTIVYYGSPRMRQSISGSGKVVRSSN